MQSRGNNNYEALSAPKAANGNTQQFTKHTPEQSLQHEDGMATAQYMTGIVVCGRRQGESMGAHASEKMRVNTWSTPLVCHFFVMVDVDEGQKSWRNPPKCSAKSRQSWGVLFVVPYCLYNSVPQGYVEFAKANRVGFQAVSS
jgi:hypothetical protein